jgi:hypothetical protein
MIPFNSYFKNILAKYPRLDNDEIISGIYTFLNTIKIKHPNAHLGTYPSTDTTYHKVSILDENNRTLGDISFKAYPNGNYGIVFSLNNREFAIKVSDEGHIDLRCDYPLCGFNTGTDEVANTKYVLDAVDYKNNLLQSSLTEFIITELDSLNTDINQRIADAIAQVKADITDEYIQYFSTHINNDNEGYEPGCSKVFHLTDKPANFGGKAKHDLFISYREHDGENEDCIILLKESNNDNASWFYGFFLAGHKAYDYIQAQSACAVVPKGYYWKIPYASKDITIVDLEYRVSSLSECTSEITSWS